MARESIADIEEDNLEPGKVIAPAIGVKYGVLIAMAHAGVVPCYFVGVKRTGLRFSLREVRAALKHPPISTRARAGA